MVALALFAAGCGGSSESEELTQVRAELDALKEQVATTTTAPTTNGAPTTTAPEPTIAEELAQVRAELAQTRAELAQTRAELDALKGQVAGSTGLMGTHQTPTTLTSPSGLRSPDMDLLEEFKTGAERREWIRTNLLIGLPWRDAEKMAHDAGWSTKVIFAVEGEPVVMTMDLALHRLRLVVVGGEEAGTVTDVVNS